MSGLRARIDHGLTGTMPVCELSGFDASLIGHEANLSLRLKVDVKRSSGVDQTKRLFEVPLRITGPLVRVPVSELPDTLYAYRGKDADMAIVARLRVDYGVIFDTTLETLLDVPMRHSPAMPRRRRHGSSRRISIRSPPICERCRRQTG